MNYRICGILGLLICVGFLASSHMAPFLSQEFKYSILGTQWKGHLFTGMSYQFHNNGYPYKFQFFWQGKQVGTEHRWYSNGVKWQEAQYKDGKQHGTTKMWYRSGKVQALKHYSDGKAHGEFWGWHANGELSDYHVFEQGQQIIYKSFISDGKPYYNFVFRNKKTIGLKAGDFCKSKKL